MSHDQKSEATPQWKRGSALSIFHTDRREDLVALALSLVIAALVYFFVG